jgi:hypothetical protein
MHYGASIAALHHLARAKGYSLVAGNKAGNNAFFVKDDFLGDLKPLTPQEAYSEAGFREGRDARGTVTYLTFMERQRSIGGQLVVDVRTLETGELRAFL